MKNRIDKIFKSIEGIKQANVKPFFYTRLTSKLKNSQNAEVIYFKYERAFQIALISFLITINIFFISNNNGSDDENILSADLEEVYFESNKNDIINLTTNEE